MSFFVFLEYRLEMTWEWVNDDRNVIIWLNQSIKEHGFRSQNMCLLWRYYSSMCFGTGMWNLSHIEQANPKPDLFSVNTQTCRPLWSKFVLFWNPEPLRYGSAWVLHLFVSTFSWTHCLANTFQRYQNTNKRTILSLFPVLYSSLPHYFSSLPFLSRHFILLKHMDCHRYLPNIVWQRRSGNFYWLKIKVAKSPPQIPPFLLEPLKNRGKHQFLTHQWRLHNQLKKTLVWGCKSYLCLIKAFRRYMPGFNVIK